MNKELVLNRDEFRELFIEPLEAEFGYKTYWNSKNLEDIGLKPTTNRGVSYTSREDSPIVLRYTKNSLDLLNTLIHEYAHSCLHSKKKLNQSMSSNMKEVEAETVARKVFEKLNLKYTELSYIEKHLKKCSTKEIFHWEDSRKYEIYDLASTISSLISPKQNTINKLNSTDTINKKEDYKYHVKCPLCKTTWKYKRKSNIIKTKAKNHYCNRCGKKDTLGKLTVSEI